MAVLKTLINENPNIGLFMYATNEYALVSVEISKDLVEEIEKALEVPVYQITIGGTGLIGALVVGNKNNLIVPKLINKDEIKKLNEFGIKYDIYEGDLTALGNNILCNDNGAIVNPDYSAEDIEWFSQKLGVPIKKGKIGNLDVPGACCVLKDDVGVISPDVEDFEGEFIEDILKVQLTTGTLMGGSPLLRAAICVNSKGFVVSSESTGPELVNVDNALGFSSN